MSRPAAAVAVRNWHAAAAHAPTDSAGAADADAGEPSPSSVPDDEEVVADPIRDSLPLQAAVRRVYTDDPCTIGVASLILANFLIAAVEKEINAVEGTRAYDALSAFEIFFTAVFSLELAVNMYAHWLRYFWNSVWNVFDFVIVAVSITSMAVPDLPGITVLRLFRAFRVVRLFKRVESLRMIVEGVGAALPGVGNAFVLLGLLMGIWAIIGVEFFGAFAQQQFGTFLDAVFTMWQIMTMDSWATSVARPLIFEAGLVVAGPFCVSFTFIAGIVMTNMVIAILLDKYLSATAELLESKRRAKAAKNAAKAQRRLARRAARQSLRSSPDVSGHGSPPARMGSVGTDLDESLSSNSSSSSEDGGSKKLDKDDLISMVAESVTREHLLRLDRAELAQLAALLWHHPALRKCVPDTIREAAAEPDARAEGGPPPGDDPNAAAAAPAAAASLAAKDASSVILNLLARSGALPPAAMGALRALAATPGDKSASKLLRRASCKLSAASGFLAGAKAGSAGGPPGRRAHGAGPRLAPRAASLEPEQPRGAEIAEPPDVVLSLDEPGAERPPPLPATGAGVAHTPAANAGSARGGLAGPGEPPLPLAAAGSATADAAAAEAGGSAARRRNRRLRAMGSSPQPTPPPGTGLAPAAEIGSPTAAPGSSRGTGS